MIKKPSQYDLAKTRVPDTPCQYGLSKTRARSL
jgi:hypothetical protein